VPEVKEAVPWMIYLKMTLFSSVGKKQWATFTALQRYINCQIKIENAMNFTVISRLLTVTSFNPK
jgi:hypothetical protein